MESRALPGAFFCERGLGPAWRGRVMRVVARGEHDPVFLIHVGDAEIIPGRPRPRAHVYERQAWTLHPEFWLDSIVARGYWVDFDGTNEEREVIEREVSSLVASARSLAY